MTTSRSPFRRCRPWLVASLACTSVLLPAGAATAGWRSSDITLIDFRDVCVDGIRFGGAVIADHGDTSPTFDSWAVAAQPPPASWADRSTFVMRTAIRIPRAPAGRTVTVEGEPEPVAISHQGSFTLRYGAGPLRLDPVALNIEDGSEQSDVVTADVTDCYLFAPLDVQPGSSRNTVPIGHGEVSVAVLGTTTLQTDRLKASTFRFGPRKASPTGSVLKDVNKDHRTDLVLRFGSVAAGLKCSTSTVRLKGQSRSGGTLEGKGTVVPTGCSS